MKSRALPAFALFARPLPTLARYFEEIARSRGPIVRFRTFRRTIFLVTAPALIEEVLVTQAHVFRRGRGHERLRALLGNGLLTSEEPAHLVNRRLVQPAFHRARLAEYARVMVDATRRRMARWRAGETIAIDAEAAFITLDIVARTLFGTDLAADAAAIGAALDDVMAAFPARMSPLGPLLEKLPVWSTRRFCDARTRLSAIVARLIEQRRSGGAPRGDVLAMLLESRDDAGAPLTDEHVRDEVLTLLLAGNETTATAIAWCFYLLGRYPDVERRVAAEVATALGGRAADVSDLARLPYLQAVLDETLRLYPPAWSVGRRAAENVTLGDCRVRRGDIVLVSPYVSQRDPAYFPIPERFDPERWTGARALPKFAYFPFGGGNRTCIGESFARLELCLVVATILQAASLVPVDEGVVEPHPFVTLRPGRAIRATVRSRPRSVS